MIFCSLLVLSGCGSFKEWSADWDGRAKLAEATHDRKIAILEAEAKRESAKHLAIAEIERAESLAKAEVIRAKGVAEANKIIGESLKENEEYLRYLWIQGMQTNNMQVVYVPTEANLPILESQRLNK